MTILARLFRLTALAVLLTLRLVEAVLNAIIVTLAWLLAPKAMLAIRTLRAVPRLSRR